MSNIWEGIYDDADKYLALCNRFNEVPVYLNGFPNSYGDHGIKLRNRLKEERELKLEEKLK
jgi:hypothetical protein